MAVDEIQLQKIVSEVLKKFHEGDNLGKPLGISLLVWLSVRLKICSLPSDLNWKLIIATGFLGGIGFTMSIFIALLAFDDYEVINKSKLTILISSLIASIVGFILLSIFLKKQKEIKVRSRH